MTATRRKEDDLVLFFVIWLIMEFCGAWIRCLYEVYGQSIPMVNLYMYVNVFMLQSDIVDDVAAQEDVSKD